MNSILPRHLSLASVRAFALVVCTSFLVVACGGGSDKPAGSSSSSSSSSSGGTVTYTVGGTITGLAASGLVLTETTSGGTASPASGDTTFTIAPAVNSGSSYAVTVTTQPATQTCVVTGGTGTASANVTSVVVTCTTNTVTIGGTITGLTASGLVLTETTSTGTASPASGDTTFTIAPAVNVGSSYAVTVTTQPTNQTCVVTGGTGTASANVTSVVVTCATNTVTVGGTITGLAGSGLVLTETTSAGTAHPAAAATSFTIAPPVNVGSAYTVTVTAQPINPSQTCVASTNTGTANANVTNVLVTCTTNTGTVGGTISGLTGTGLIMRDTANGNHQVTVLANATTFAISPAIPSGTAYTVVAFAQPNTPTQSCVVTNGTGTVGVGNVTSVVVTCTTTPFTIGGTLSGLNGNSVTLTDSVSGHTKTVSANGAYTFTQQVNSGIGYNVTVTTQPTGPAQFCTVTGGVGTVTNATVNNINVSCKNVGRRVFVANPFDSTNGSVAAFTINPATGALTAVAGSPFLSGGPDFGPTALALDPSGNFLYVANQGTPPPAATPVGAGISTYSIAGNGVLTADSVVGSPFSTGGVQNSPDALVIDPAGPYLYAASNDAPTGTVEGFSIAAGILTPLNSQTSGNVPFSIAIDTTNHVVWAPNVFDGAISEFTLTAGALSAPNYSGALTNPFAVAVDPTGTYVYITDNTANTVTEFTYSTITGSLTAGAGITTGAASVPTGIAIDPSGAFLYVSDSGTGKVSAFTINPANGHLTAIAGSPFTASGTASPTTPTALAVDPSSQFLYVANGDAGTISVFKITAGTGVLTAVNLAVNCISAGGGPQAIIIQ